MASLIIYGASDDLIEVDGDYRNEYPTDGQGKDIILVAGYDIGGVALIVPYMGPLGDWTTDCKFLGPACNWKSATIDRPDHYGEDGDKGVQLDFPDENFGVFLASDPN